VSRQGLRERVSDRLERTLTDIELESAPVLALGAIVIGVLGGVFSPHVESRSDANSLQAVFIGLLAGVIGVLAIYAALTKRRGGRARQAALLVAVVGCVAALAGLANLPLDAYRYVFAVTVAAVAFQALCVVTLVW
jgi:hypothetical protein